VSRERIVVAAVQWRFTGVEHADAWFARARAAIGEAVARGAELVVLPEYVGAELLSAEPAMLTGDAAVDRSAAWQPPLDAFWRELATTHGIAIVGGSQLTRDAGGLARNVCTIALPDGSIHHRTKVHATPNERAVWSLAGGDAAEPIDWDGFRFAVAICYDSEFPELPRHLVDRGAELLCVPYCTETAAGHWRVRHCAAARAVENQCYVVTAGLTGDLPRVDNLDAHWADSAILGPCDTGFPPDGVLAAAGPERHHVLVAELDLLRLRALRREGTVLNRADRRHDLYRVHWSGG
jgi:predicted amidohydrolase